jgi:hypothetical protein
MSTTPDDVPGASRRRTITNATVEQAQCKFFMESPLDLDLDGSIVINTGIYRVTDPDIMDFTVMLIKRTVLLGNDDDSAITLEVQCSGVNGNGTLCQ